MPPLRDPAMEEPSPRPQLVTILAAFVLSITAWNGIRVWSAASQWSVLQEFGAPPAYLLATGLLWTVTGLWLTYALWTQQRAALAGGLLLAGLYFGWYWLDRLAVQPSPAPNLLFSLTVSTALLAIFGLGLFATRNFLNR